MKKPITNILNDERLDAPPPRLGTTQRCSLSLLLVNTLAVLDSTIR